MLRPPRPRFVLAAVIGLSLGSTALVLSLHPSGPLAPASPAATAAGPLVEPFVEKTLAARPDTSVSALSSAIAAALDPGPETAALRAWTERYLSTPPTSRDALLAEGVALAKTRRVALAALIRSDPESALAAAFPRALRPLLPATVAAELEELVSDRAELSVIQTCLHPPGVAHDPAEDLYRATVIDGREYRVYVYGSRLRDASLPATSLHGIALDGHLAVDASRLRILGPDETPPSGSPAIGAGALAVEADGVVTVLPSPDDLPAFAAALIATEQNPVIHEADSGAGSSTVSGRPAQAWTHGAKTLLVIRVDFSDLPGTPINTHGNALITPAYIDTVINGPAGVRAFMQANSYGKSDLLFDPALDVTAVLRLPTTAYDYALAGNNSLLHADARTAATTAGFDVSAYDRVAVVFSDLGGFVDPDDNTNKSQITYGGLATIIGANLWINGAFDLRVVGHELGHNYGLRHANLWTPTGGSPVSLNGDDPATPDEDERSLEYGDPFDLMGGGGSFENDFSHWNKSLLQWIPDAAVTVATSSGTYRVHRFDAPAADLVASRALKIVRDTTRDYWIGYRRGLASSATDNGAYVLWGYNSNQQGNLLDLTTPGTSSADAPLSLNTTFNDSAAGITLRPVAQGGSGADEWLDIQVSFQPRLAWTASSYVVNEQGGSAVLTVTRNANATGNVSVSYATAPGTAAATTDYPHTTGTLTWLDGDTAPKTITIPLVADALVEGTETFTVTLSAPVGGVIVDPATSTVTLADPGARDPSFATPNIGNTVQRVLVQPDGKILIAGAFPFIQTPDFTVYNHIRISRLTALAGVDPDFNPGTGANGTIRALARQPDGKILIGGDFTTFDGVARNRIARLHPDGSLDASFNPGAGADATIYDMLVQPDGKLLVAGNLATYNGTARNRLARLNADGTLDAAFANPSYSSNGLRALALQPDGKILAAGGLNYNFGEGGGVGFKSGIVRLLADGTRDTTFDVGYGAHTSLANNATTQVLDVAVLPDGRILLGGAFTGFGNNFTPRRIVRLSSTGVLDTTFTPAPDNTVQALRPLPDGSVLIGGDFTTVGGTAATRVARILANGTLDTAFAATGGHGATVLDLTLQADGNVLLNGVLGSAQGSPTILGVWRLVPGLSALPGVLQFATDSAQGAEGGSVSLGVNRVGGSLGALTVGYATVPGTAATGVDFTPTSGSLSWTDGDTSTKTITVPLPLDAAADTPETFLINLGSPVLGGAVLGERQQATVTIQTAFDGWRATHFSIMELSAPATSGDTADPDGDGLNNLAEFALARDPRTPDATAATPTAIQNSGGTNYLTITFRRRVPALDLAYAVQTSGDLSGAWTTDAIQLGTPTSHGDGTETVTYRDSVATTAAARRFLRVQVTRTP